jgi:hypothetical protein
MGQELDCRMHDRRRRLAGLKGTKVAAFSPTHTALRFVIPVAAR